MKLLFLICLTGLAGIVLSSPLVEHDEGEPVDNSSKSVAVESKKQDKKTASLSKKIEPISETSLYSNVFYKISFSKYPNGILTFSDVTSNDDCYVLSEELDPDKLPNYGGGQNLELNSEWSFLPTSEPEWFSLWNEGFSQLHNLSAVVSLSKEEVETEVGQRYVTLCLKPGKKSGVSDGSKWKVTSAGDGKYKLINKKLPKATFRKTVKKNGQYSHFIEIDSRPHHEVCYKPGGKWFDEVTLTFTESRIKLGDKVFYLVKNLT